jgi:hypothetical protein
MTEKDKIQQLEDRISNYEQDGVVGLYYTLQLKLNELNKVLRDTKITLDDSGDRTFERFMKAATECRDIAENIKWLRLEFSLTGDEEKDQKSSRPLIEKLVQRNK